MRKYNEKSNICGEIIRKHREALNMSGEALARQLQLRGLNIEKSHISRMENGEVIIKDFELILICQILDIDYLQLETLL